MHHIFALLIISCILIFGFAKKIPAYSPLMISAFIWLFVFSVGMFYEEDFNPIQDDILIAWVLWFVISSIIYILLSQSRSVNYNEQITRFLPVDYSLVMLGLIAWLSYQIFVIGNTGPSHFLLNLRLSSNGIEDYENLGLVGRAYPVVFALFIFENIYATPNNSRLRILNWIWMLLYALATMGKFAILTPIVTWIVIRCMQEKISKKKVIWLSAITFSLMMLAHFMRIGADDDSSFGQVFSIYTYSPLIALGFMDRFPETQSFGPYVFRFLYAIGHQINVSDAPVEVILPYVEVPISTNVYTVMQPFFHDFGMAGVTAGSIFYGILFGLLFNFARKLGGFFLAVYAAFSTVLIAQFFSETFLMNLSGNLQQVIALIIIFSLSKRKKNAG